MDLRKKGCKNPGVMQPHHIKIIPVWFSASGAHPASFQGENYGLGEASSRETSAIGIELEVKVFNARSSALGPGRWRAGKWAPVFMVIF